MSLAIRGPETTTSTASLPLKGPGRDRPVRAAHAQAGVPAQIVDAFRPPPPPQIVGAADHGQRVRWRQTHRDHIGLDELALPDAGVKSSGSDIDQLRACGDLNLDLGIGSAERRDQPLQQDRHHRPRHREAQQSGRPLPKVTRDLACGDKLLESGLCAQEKSFAGFGQPDTASRAYEERCADPRLKRTHGLADRRRRHRKLGSRFAKTAVLGNAEERLHAVERTVPDCEVLLHNPSTLSRIMDGGKPAYI
jgi:hypothetical protein